MRGKVNYSGHALHGKMVDLDGEEWGGNPSLPAIACYRILMPQGHAILLPKDKIRVLSE